jgi:hypothetical protein
LGSDLAVAVLQSCGCAVYILMKLRDKFVIRASFSSFFSDLKWIFPDRKEPYDERRIEEKSESFLWQFLTLLLPIIVTFPLLGDTGTKKY